MVCRHARRYALYRFDDIRRRHMRAGGCHGGSALCGMARVRMFTSASGYKARDASALYIIIENIDASIYINTSAAGASALLR